VANPKEESYTPTIGLESFRRIPTYEETEVGRPWLSVVSERRLVSLGLTLYGGSDIAFWQTWIG
jgi:hypothetical protein